MSDLSLWGLVVAISLGTFALRFSFIGLHGRLHIPPVLKRAPGLRSRQRAGRSGAAGDHPAGPGPEHPFTLDNLRLPAALVAALVAWKSHNTLLTLTAGMGTLWFLEWLL